MKDERYDEISIPTPDEAVLEASQGTEDIENYPQNEELIASDDVDKQADTKNNDETIKTEYGKFKNPQELLKAYNELEKEFTRRSQKLKEYESSSQAYKSEAEWKVAVDKFFKRTPSAKAYAREIAKVIVNEPELRQDRACLDIAFNKVLLDSYRSPAELMEDGQFLDKYVYGSEKIRNKVIADYLSSIAEGKPPRTIGSDGMQCVAPSLRPRTIEEAGFMFLKDNK